VRFFVVMAANAVLGLGRDQQFRPTVRRTAMASTIRHLPATQPAELAELRLLIELHALRRLADRGLSDQELALVRKLARAASRAARRGDVSGYQRADTIFHLCLLELTGDPALSDLARLLLEPDRIGAPSSEESQLLMASEAREHAALIGRRADGMVNAADQLLRGHLSRRGDGRMAPARVDEPELIGAQGG
jgi:DNA-binding GntR family transcriptional regulator